MPEEPVDMTQELLPQMRAEQTALRSVLECRFDMLETDVAEMKRTLRGLTYMMATFTGRLEEVEARVDHISTHD